MLLTSCVFILEMKKTIIFGVKYTLQYTFCNITQWHIWATQKMKTSPENQWSWKLVIKIIEDLDFYVEKTDFYLNLFVDYFVTLYTAPFQLSYLLLYPNLNKRLKLKLEVCLNKCIWFYLNLNNRDYICLTEFEEINWLPVNDYFE